MPWRNGLYVRLQSWVARAAAGAPISAVEFDADGNDEASALNNCVLRDGTGAPTADLPMANHSLTGIRPAVASGEPLEYAQGKALIASSGGSVSNRLQNASFLVNQRGVSGPITLAANAYGHDRWKAGAGGCGYSVGTSGADGQATIGSGSLVQVIAASDIDSATMTVSQAGAAQGRLYTVGGTPPGFQACPFTVTNLTPGQPAILEWATGTVLQAQVQPGTSASPFSRRPVALDALLCQAYFENVPFSMSLDAYVTSPRVPFTFKTTKVSPPSLTITIVSSLGLSGASAANVTTDGFGLTFGASGNSVTAVGFVAASAEP